MVNRILELDFKDVVMTCAVILGPILAVQIQKYLEQFRDKKQRRLNIFRTLMSTRAERISKEHVQALNMIDIEFYGQLLPIIRIRYQNKLEQSVTHAWKSYNSHLDKCSEYKDTNIWIAKGDDLFTDLLYALSQSMNYDFDKVQLQRDCYRPVAHGNIEMTQMRILLGIEKILTGDGSLPMHITSFVNNSDVTAKTATNEPDSSVDISKKAPPESDE
ncbi:DUF6680 family protein [Serratia fonticola]|uniref:DUF6680 family protein n=1 Tax=Serratia fonticola TaxID=47917 RepID=UPI000E0E97B1|nr:DUF6680 family protein [Serratia fonticola]RDL16144.1 hypothetical protein DFO62_12175 [Serratia fonticola]